MKKILVIGSPNPPYHSLSNLSAFIDILVGYELTFSENEDDLLNINNYDLLINYLDAWQRRLTDAQASALKSYLNNGGKILSIHNGISIQDTPLLADVTGARFTGHPAYCELTITPIANHPIMQGIQTFTINDEPYQFEPSDDIEILATYEHNGKTIPAAWVRDRGEGTFAYLMPGHDAGVFQCRQYIKLIQNSVKYLVNLYTKKPPE
jgi:hypothetical protein